MQQLRKRFSSVISLLPIEDCSPSKVRRHDERRRSVDISLKTFRDMIIFIRSGHRAIFFISDFPTLLLFYHAPFAITQPQRGILPIVGCILTLPLQLSTFKIQNLDHWSLHDKKTFNRFVVFKNLCIINIVIY